MVGKKAAVLDDYITFDIDQVLAGPTIDQTIKIAKGYGADCGEAVQNFDSDKSYILILHEPGQNDIYRISICLYAVLEYANGLVSGRIDSEEHQIMTFEQFVSKLSCFDRPVNLLNVSAYVTSERLIYLNNQTEMDSEVSIDVMDTQGRLIWSSTLSFNESSTQIIPLPFDVPSGIYLLYLQNDMYSQSEKLLIQ